MCSTCTRRANVLSWYVCVCIIYVYDNVCTQLLCVLCVCCVFHIDIIMCLHVVKVQRAIAMARATSA
jgi:hypothetical protein